MKKLIKKLVVDIFTLLLADFAPKLVNYSRHSESLNIRKNCEIVGIFLRWQRFVEFQTCFKDSLCREHLINLDAKDAKRSVKMWTTNFFKCFFNVYLMTILLVQENKSGGHFLFSYLARSLLGGGAVTFESRSFFSRIETVMITESDHHFCVQGPIVCIIRLLSWSRFWKMSQKSWSLKMRSEICRGITHGPKLSRIEPQIAARITVRL